MPNNPYIRLDDSIAEFRDGAYTGWDKGALAGAQAAVREMEEEQLQRIKAELGMEDKK